MTTTPNDIALANALERGHFLGCSSIDDDDSGCDCLLPDVRAAIEERDRFAKAVAKKTCGFPCDWCGRKYGVHTQAGPHDHASDCLWLLAVERAR
jgi:hypothetical protein